MLFLSFVCFGFSFGLVVCVILEVCFIHYSLFFILCVPCCISFHSLHSVYPIEFIYCDLICVSVGDKTVCYSIGFPAPCTHTHTFNHIQHIISYQSNVQGYNFTVSLLCVCVLVFSISQNDQVIPQKYCFE